MKKLLLASIIMMGISTVAEAQTPEAVQAKKAAAKKEANQPVFSNAANQTAVAPNSEQAKSADVLAAEKNAAAKPKTAEVKEVKKAAKPAAKKSN